MSDKTGIQWTDATWNPVIGCARVSEGCRNCYAEEQAARIVRMNPTSPYGGVVRWDEERGTLDDLTGPQPLPRWNGKAVPLPERLDQPLRWSKPRLVFVNSMSDLFHPDVPFEFVAATFGIMAATPRHTYQVLTKRPERAREFFAWLARRGCGGERRFGDDYPSEVLMVYAEGEGVEFPRSTVAHLEWPLPNVWLGVSVENQEAADERIPILLDLPAAVRWISAEPLLGPVNLRDVAPGPEGVGYNVLRGVLAGDTIDAAAWRLFGAGFLPDPRGPRLDWIVVGGESGRQARPCALEWIGDIVRQAGNEGVPVFVKQLGAHVVSTERTDGDEWAWRMGTTHTKGGDPDEWPEAIRAREWPIGWDGAL